MFVSFSQQSSRTRWFTRCKDKVVRFLTCQLNKLAGWKEGSFKRTHKKNCLHLEYNRITSFGMIFVDCLTNVLRNWLGACGVCWHCAREYAKSEWSARPSSCLAVNETFYTSVVSRFSVRFHIDIIWHTRIYTKFIRLGLGVERTENARRGKEKLSNHLYLWELIIPGLFWPPHVEPSSSAIQMNYTTATIFHIILLFIFVLFVCFCLFLFYFSCMCADLPMLPLSLLLPPPTKTKYSSSNFGCVHAIAPMTTVFVWPNSKTIRTHTRIHTIHIYWTAS